MVGRLLSIPDTEIRFVLETHATDTGYSMELRVFSEYFKDRAAPKSSYQIQRRAEHQRITPHQLFFAFDGIPVLWEAGNRILLVTPLVTTRVHVDEDRLLE